MADLVESMKKAALDAVEAAHPVAVMFGTVSSESPLKINVEQKLILEKEQLILTRNVAEYKTEPATDSESGLSHSHVVHPNLKQGDSVALLRVQGGQKFLVLDVMM